MDQRQNAPLPTADFIRKLRHRSLEIRTRVHEAHNYVLDCLGHFDESREQFMKLVKQTAYPTNFIAIEQIEAQLNSDGQALKNAVKELRPLQNELKDLDYQLFNAEPIPQYFLHDLDRFEVFRTRIG